MKKLLVLVITCLIFAGCSDSNSDNELLNIQEELIEVNAKLATTLSDLVAAQEEIIELKTENVVLKNELEDEISELLAKIEELETNTGSDEDNNTNEDPSNEAKALNIDQQFYDNGSVVFGPNQARAAMIDIIDLEVIGNLFLYDHSDGTTTQLTNLDYSSQQTIKKVIWFNNNRLMFIKGFNGGTITMGGDLYLYDLETNQEFLVVTASDNSEIVDVEIINQDVLITEVTWTDANYMNYEFTQIIMGINDF